MDLSELRNRVSMILQDNSIFTGTVLQNIALGDEFPDFDRAVRAAKVAEAHEFISQLSSGYATILGDGSKDLSGGQKQRISIARAIYRTPEVLVLDEATSALDSITEKKVLRNLREELKDTTCFTIAHRLNTIIDSDRILVVKNGKIVEQGKHEDLLKMQGAYFDLFKKQMNLA
jgi:ABC-type multidrug transport system fused ATPase/permease subunit